MSDPSFWVRANVFYDRSGRLEDLFPIQELLLEMVFIRRQEEKFTHTALMLSAVRGGDQKAITDTFDAYLKAAFPFLNVKDAEDERQKKMHEELERMSNSMIVFTKPQEIKKNPLKGPSGRIIGAAQDNKQRGGG